MKKAALTNKEYDPYYELYLRLVDDETQLMKGFEQELEYNFEFYRNIPVEKLHYQYAQGKWTPKEVLQHIIDTERIFCYRALRIARKDFTELPGFDQDAFVPTSYANLKSLDQLLNEYKSLRLANISLYAGFNTEMLSYLGKASNGPISVRAIPFILMGHEKHHINLFKERYEIIL